MHTKIAWTAHGVTHTLSCTETKRLIIRKQIWYYISFLLYHLSLIFLKTLLDTYCTYYFTKFEEMNCCSSWSSFVWQLKCRYWGCFFVSRKRNPRRQRQPSGCPIFYWEGEKFGQTHPTIQQWIHRKFYGHWKKGWHLNIYPTDGFFYVCMYSVLTNQLIYFWFRQVSVVPSFSSWRTSRVWTMMVFLTKMSFPHRRTSYWQNWALYN